MTKEDMYIDMIYEAASYAYLTNRFSGNQTDYQDGYYNGMFDMIMLMFEDVSMNQIDKDIREEFAKIREDKEGIIK